MGDSNSLVYPGYKVVKSIKSVVAAVSNGGSTNNSEKYGTV